MRRCFNKLLRQNMLLHIQIIAATAIRNLLKVLWLFPVQKNKIFFISFAGKQYTCNPKYLTEYLLDRYPGKFKIVWMNRTMDGAAAPPGVKFAKFPYPPFCFHFCTASVIVVNGGMPTFMPKRKSQVLINTWHGGGAYKGAGDDYSSNIRRSLSLYKGKNTDIFLSSSRVFTEKVIPLVLYGEHYQCEVLNSGMPRNDLFFSESCAAVREKTRAALGIDRDTFIVLYAPTYRGLLVPGISGLHSSDNLTAELDIERLKSAVEKKYGRKSVVLFRRHITSGSGQASMAGATDVSAYQDMQHLLCAADMLITDYSSSIWDFSFLKRPCYLYVPDLQEYLSIVKFLTPIETWPGILVKSDQQLEQAILAFDQAAYDVRMNEYHKSMGSYEIGKARQIVCERIAAITGIDKE